MATRARRHYRIRNESDAWSALNEILSSDYDGTPSIEFVGWPILRVDSNLGNASLRPEMMRAFVDLQDALWRSYSITSRGDANIALLTDDDRRALEFDVEVRPGSSNTLSNLQKVFEAYANRVKKMEPSDVATKTVIIALGAALLYCGSVAWKDHIAGRVEMRKAELHNSQVIADLEARKLLSQEETKRMQIMQEAYKEVGLLRRIKDQADEAKMSLYRHVPEGTEVTIQGIELSSVQTKEIAKTNRAEARTEELSSEFRVIEVSTQNDQGFRVQMRNLRTGETMSVVLPQADEFSKTLKVLERAVFGKLPISATISVTRRRGAAVKARFISASLFPGGWAAIREARQRDRRR